MAKNPEINIYSFLRKNRAITLSTVILCTIIVVSAFVFSYKVYTYNMNNTLTIDKDGMVLPMKWYDRDQNIGIEIKNHLKLWLETYHTYDQLSIEEKKRRSKFLISENDFNKLQIFYDSKDWFDDVAKFYLKVKGTIVEDNISVIGNKEPFSFKANAIIEVNRGMVSDFYNMSISGNIILVERNWPLNPHGMIIYNYKESELNKIKTENNESR